MQSFPFVGSDGSKVVAQSGDKGTVRSASFPDKLHTNAIISARSSA
jgi:hypothetical protein